MKSNIFAVAVLFAVPVPLAAQDGAVTPRQIREGKVTACSSYGHKCYTAKLVRSPVGWKMRLNGGTLIDCSVTCQDTLRIQTVDFWQDQRERGTD